MALAVALGVALLAAVPGTAAAAKRPDLKVVGLSSAGFVEAGRPLSLTVKVRNVGPRKARASKVRVVLSKDRVLGAGDVVLATTRIGALKPGKKAVLRLARRVPEGTTKGRYHLVACADVKQQVRERREGNNCRVRSGKVRVTAPPTPPPDDPVFPLEADPLAAGYTVDEGRSTTRTVYPYGSPQTFAATGADGTRYELTVPGRAVVAPVDVTITPVTEVTGLPLGGGLVGAVEIRPHGLQLVEPARLTITPAEPGSVHQQTGILFHESGEDAHQYPLGLTDELTMTLTHFSTAGVALTDPADRATLQARVPARTESQYQAMVADLLQTERTSILAGNPPDPSVNAAWNDLANAYHDDIVAPLLEEALTNDGRRHEAVVEALNWARQMELLGLADEGRLDALWSTVLRVMELAANAAAARCLTEHSLEDVTRLLGFARLFALLGAEDYANELTDDVDRCVSFEVDFDSVIDTEHSWPVEGHAFGSEGSSHFAVSASGISLNVNGQGSGVLDYDAFDSHSVATYPRNAGASCQLRQTTTGIGTTAGELRVWLALDFSLYQPAAPGAAPLPSGRLQIMVEPRPSERYRTVNSGCSSDIRENDQEHWYGHFDSNPDHRVTGWSDVDVPVWPSDQVGAVVLRQHFSRDVGTGGIDGRTVEESTVRVTHTPRT